MSVSDFLFSIKGKKPSSKIRLYLIDKDKHYFINDGILKNGFNPKLSITKNMVSVLSAESGFRKFSNDFQKAWKTLLKIYVIEQEKIDWKKLSEL
jgi:hypothetical protein